MGSNDEIVHIKQHIEAIWVRMNESGGYIVRYKAGVSGHMVIWLKFCCNRKQWL